MSSPRLSPRSSFGRRALCAGVLPFLLAPFLLASCGDRGGKAPDDVHRFLTAVMADDRQVFEDLVDRRAVREDLRRQMVEVARIEGLMIEGGPSDFALDRLVTPATLRLVQAGDGMVQAPSADDLKTRLRALERGRVCLPAASEKDRCVLTFAREGSGPWRLVAMEATGLNARVPTY